MFVKKFKKKCGVRGCKNTHNVFVISKRREMGNTIAMCTDCIKETFRDIESYAEPKKEIKEPQPLFPHPELEVTISSVADNEPEPTEVIEEATEEFPISVAEDTVTMNFDEIKPTTPTTKPKTTANNKKKTNKKK